VDTPEEPVALADDREAGTLRRTPADKRALAAPQVFQGVLGAANDPPQLQHPQRAPLGITLATIGAVAVAGIALVWICNLNRGVLTPVKGVPWVIPLLVILLIAQTFQLTRTRLGRYIYAIGANEKAAALNGIPVRRYVIGVFVASGVITGLAGCVLGAKLRIGQANVGLDFLLPALVGAFLGSTTIKPGRVNVWGSVFGILILAVGISGIQLFGGAFFVEPLFNGMTLVVAIALAAFAQRRRTVVKPPRETPPAAGAEESANADRAA